MNYSSVVSNGPTVVDTHEQKELLPGWVSLEYGPNLKVVYRYGPPVPLALSAQWVLNVENYERLCFQSRIDRQREIKGLPVLKYETETDTDYESDSDLSVVSEQPKSKY